MSTYHVLPNGPLTYDEYVGLDVQIERVRLRRAIETLLGTSAANSARLLSRSWFDALARHEAQIEGLQSETNTQRAEVQAMTRSAGKAGK